MSSHPRFQCLPSAWPDATVAQRISVACRECASQLSSAHLLRMQPCSYIRDDFFRSVSQDATHVRAQLRFRVMPAQLEEVLHFVLTLRHKQRAAQVSDGGGRTAPEVVLSVDQRTAAPAASAALKLPVTEAHTTSRYAYYQPLRVGCWTSSNVSLSFT